jgi:hypothetical protein
VTRPTLSSWWTFVLAAACAVGLGAGCSGPTEIVVVVDTDITSVDELAVEARVADGVAQRATATLASQPAPRRLVLEHRGGPLGPVRIVASARRGADELVRVERTATFSPGARVEVRVTLEAACVGVSCPFGSCERGVCNGCSGSTCADAGVPDAADDARLPDDAWQPDAAVAPCPLEAGLCGVPLRVAVGDRWVVGPCATGVPGTIDYRITPPVGEAMVGETLEVTDIGVYQVSASVADVPGCEASLEVTAPPLEIASSDGRPTGWAPVIRGLAARLDMAFLATSQGAFGVVVDTGWFNVATAAAATLPSEQGGVAMSGARPVFIANAASVIAWSFDVVSPTSASVRVITLPESLTLRTISAAFVRGGGGMGAVMGAPLSTSRHDRIALAWNDERRQLWALDASGALRVLDVSR